MKYFLCLLLAAPAHAYQTGALRAHGHSPQAGDGGQLGALAITGPLTVPATGYFGGVCITSNSITNCAGAPAISLTVSSMSLQGSTTVQGTLNVQGATTLSSATLQGSTTIQNTLSVQSTTTIGAGLFVSTFNTSGGVNFAVNFASGVAIASGSVQFADGTQQATAASSYKTVVASAVVTANLATTATADPTCNLSGSTATWVASAGNKGAQISFMGTLDNSGANTDRVVMYVDGASWNATFGSDVVKQFIVTATGQFPIAVNLALKSLSAGTHSVCFGAWTNAGTENIYCGSGDGTQVPCIITVTNLQ